MKNKLRIRRLTLAIASEPEDVHAEWPSGVSEVDRILDKERMARMMELAASTSNNSSGHHIHGVEDHIGY
jgi:hypothetical protein